MRYWLFAGMEYYPRGGACDLLEKGNDNGDEMNQQNAEKAKYERASRIIAVVYDRLRGSGLSKDKIKNHPDYHAALQRGKEVHNAPNQSN